MDAHEYICFSLKFEYFMYFLVDWSFVQFFSDSGPVPNFRVDQFGDWFSSDNIGLHQKKNPQVNPHIIT